MTEFFAFTGVLAAAFVLMEGVAWASHKYLMHGPLWFLHRSHHQPGRGGWEANDWFGVFFSLPSMGLIAAGAAGRPLLLAAGCGMAAYGLAYLVFHDALVHGRFGRIRTPRNPFLSRLVAAHRIHHARREREGCRAFGFLLPPMTRDGNGPSLPLGDIHAGSLRRSISRGPPGPADASRKSHPL